MSYCSRRKFADRRVDLLLARPVGKGLAVGADQHVAVDHAELVAHAAEEAGVVGMADAGAAQHVQRDEGRAYRADVLHRAAAVRPDDQRRLVLAAHLADRRSPAGDRLLHEARFDIDGSERRQMVAEEGDDRLPFALRGPVDQPLQPRIGIGNAFGVGQRRALRPVAQPRVDLVVGIGITVRADRARGPAASPRRRRTAPCVKSAWRMISSVKATSEASRPRFFSGGIRSSDRKRSKPKAL